MTLLDHLAKLEKLCESIAATEANSDPTPWAIAMNDLHSALDTDTVMGLVAVARAAQEAWDAAPVPHALGKALAKLGEMGTGAP